MTYLDQNETSPGNGLKSNEQVLIDDYDFSIGELISEGLDLFKKGAGNYVAFTLVFLIISVILGLIPIIGTLASLLITPPLSAGFFIVTDKIKRNEAYTFSNFFDGYKLAFGNLIVLSIVSTILVILGFLLLVLPGIYLAIGYTLAVPIMLFTTNPFWESMELSRKVVSQRFWLFLGTFILIGLIGVIFTAITIGLGALIVMPVGYIIIYLIFYKIFNDPQAVPAA